MVLECAYVPRKYEIMSLVSTCNKRRRRIRPVWSVLVFLLFEKYRINTGYERNANILGRLCSWVCWFVYDQIGNPEDVLVHIKPGFERQLFCCMKNTKTYNVDQLVYLGSPVSTLVIEFINRLSTNSPECIV